MTTEAIAKEKQRIEARKQRLRLQEKILKEKEKRARYRKLSAIGLIAKEAQIDHLDPDILLSAFIEVAEAAKDADQLEKWKEIGLTLQQDDVEGSNEQITILFRTPPDAAITERLRQMRFKWNSFRKEFYGHGSREQLEKILDHCDYELEVIDD